MAFDTPRMQRKYNDLPEPLQCDTIVFYSRLLAAQHTKVKEWFEDVNPMTDEFMLCQRIECKLLKSLISWLNTNHGLYE